MKLRPAVRRFAEAMERKLRKRDDLHGEAGWKDATYQYLLERLQEEGDELSDAVCRWPKRICGEAVDVANFAMMIFDKKKDGSTI